MHGRATGRGCGLLIGLLIGGLALAAERAPDPVRVYYDQSRSVRFATCKGAREYFADAVDLSLAAVSPARIAPYDVVVACEHPERRYAAGEVEALRLFVANGGGLLICGTASAALAGAFGIEFTDAAAVAPLSFHLSPRTPDQWTGAGARIAPRFGQHPVIVDADGQPVAVALSPGRGRVLALNADGLAHRLPDAAHAAARGRQLQAMAAWLGKARAGDRRLPRPATGPFGLHPGERGVTFGAFRVRYSEVLPVETVQIIVRTAPRIYAVLAREYGHGATEPRTIWVLPCAGSGFTSGRTVGIGGLGSPEAVEAVLIHELSNSLCVDAPVWLGDGGFSRIMHSRVRQQLGGEAAERGRREEEQLLQRWRAYEAEHGNYDITTGTNYPVGAGKLLNALKELEELHGRDLLARYCRAARQWQAPLRARQVAAIDRMAFYFSIAAGRDLSGFFAARGFPVSRASMAAPPGLPGEAGNALPKRPPNG
ncbi:MAG: hypothetical protein GXY85_05005 [Candidatus Brocadiaceae bacterium]|nr:hypothetical protein [Candidatus Brocadiaceae bacterium]